MLYTRIYNNWSIPVVLLSKAWACGRSLAEVVGSNLAGRWMFVCCEC